MIYGADETGDVDKQSLNTIFYGPPGTGKTYRTIDKALSILERVSEKSLQEEERSSRLKRFNEYKERGEILFTTFHQSL